MQYLGAQTIAPGPADVIIPTGYHNGSGKVSAVVVPTSKLVEGNTVAGQAGTLKDFSRAKLGTGPAYVAAKSARGDYGGNLVMETDTGYNTSGLNATGFGSIAAYDPNYIAANIVSGKSIFGVAGTAGGYSYLTGSTTHNSGNALSFVKKNGGSQSMPSVSETWSLPRLPMVIILWRQDLVTSYQTVYIRNQDSISIGLDVYSYTNSGNAIATTASLQLPVSASGVMYDYIVIY